MRLITTILMAIGVIGILVFIGLVTGYFLYSLTPAIEDHMSLVPVTYDSVKSFDQKIDTFKEDIEASVAAGEKRKTTLTISEEEINSKMIELLAEEKLPLKEILINFKEDFCWVYAVLDNPGVDAKIGIIAQIEIVNDDIKVTVADFHLGKLPLPKSADDRVGNLLGIMAKMQGPTEDLPLELTGIEIGDGKFIIEGMTKVAK